MAMAPNSYRVVSNLDAVMQEKDGRKHQKSDDRSELVSTCSSNEVDALTIQTGKVVDPGVDIMENVASVLATTTGSISGVSSIGSYAPTLANATTTNTNTSDGSRIISDVAVASDAFPASSSVGATIATLKNQLVETWDNNTDAVSSVGSFAPTLANNATVGRTSVASIKCSKEVLVPFKDGTTRSSDNCDDDISSVGSDAPTMATKRSTKTLRDTSVCVQEGADYDDGVSSVGMSKAPTLAGNRSVAASTRSVSFNDREVSVRFTESDNVSALGSRAPTLAPLRGEVDRSLRMRAKVSTATPARASTKQKQMPKTYLPDSVCDDKNSGASFDHYASDVALLGGVLGREELKSGLEDVVGTFLRRGAYVGIGLWLCLLGGIVFIAPLSSYQYMTGPEQMTSAALLTLLIGVNMSRLGPLLVSDRNYNFLNSGAMMASCAVQFMAIASVAIMLFLPTPVLIDPITGIRTHLVRWAEWTALSFVMTFLTESIDLPLEDADAKHAWAVAICIALSTVCGGIFPFCTNVASWWIVFTISWLLFCVLYVRLLWRGVRLLRMPEAVTTADKEDHERAKYSFKLLIICTCIWTFLAATWTVCALAHQYAEPGSFWANDWLILAVENFCEALSKIGYLSILLEVHEVLFDDVSKTARRLGELRAYMSAVWDVSTDVVIICSSHDHMVNAAVSPAIFKMESAFGVHQSKKQRPGSEVHELMTLVMEVDPYEGSYQTFEMDLSKPMSREEANTMMKNSRNKARMITPIFEKNLKVLSDLVCDACTIAVPAGQSQYVVRRDFFCVDREREEQPLCCEAKIVKLKGKAFLILLRDVTQHTIQHNVKIEASVNDHTEEFEGGEYKCTEQDNNGGCGEETQESNKRSVVERSEARQGCFPAPGDACVLS